MEVSAFKPHGLSGLRGPTPLLRLQSDERLVALTRRGNQSAFEALVARYQSRLLAFCRHMLNSREDAEDVLQEVFAAGFNAMVADERPINVRPWLYRIARNRSLNHLRRQTAIGVDSMDVHLADHGLTTADKVHRREEFRQLVGDVQELPETQRTALLLREIDALSYEQIADVMETTIPSVKSLLVRARVSLAEMSQARKLTCVEVRQELGEVAEGLTRMSPAVRRHIKTCERCAGFRQQLKETNKALAAIMPVAPLLFLKKFVLAQLGTTASAGGAAAGAAAASTASAGAASALSAGIGTVASKAAATLAAAAIVTAGAVEVDHATNRPVDHRPHAAQLASATPPPSTPVAAPKAASVVAAPQPAATKPVAQPTTDVKGDAREARVERARAAALAQRKARAAAAAKAQAKADPIPTTTTPATTTPTTTTPATTTPATTTTVPPSGSVHAGGDVTVLPTGAQPAGATPTAPAAPPVTPPPATTPSDPATPPAADPAATDAAQPPAADPTTTTPADTATAPTTTTPAP
jgi:RNA polymerase sigma factor (sigma-70 family)